MSLSEQQKQIIELLDSENALNNPHKENVATTKQSISQAITDVENTTILTQQEIQDIVDQLNTFDSTLDIFKDHTDRLSGVVFNNLGTDPDVNSLLSVSRARAQLITEKGGNRETALEEARKIFGSFYQITDEIFEGYINYINTIITYIEAQGGPLRTPSEIVSTIQEFIDEIVNQIDADNAEYDKAINELRSQGLMYEISVSQDPPSASSVIVDETIGTDTLKDILN